jgi:hypothetical protein
VAWPGCAFDHIKTREVHLDEASSALVNNAIAAAELVHPDLAPAPLERDPHGEETEPALFPPTLVRAISYIESQWAMAAGATARGKVGPVLTSSSCAYGIMQVLSGMQPQNRRGVPTALQRLILKDHSANIQGGLDLLAAKWNYAGPRTWPWVGDRDPAVLENWYYAAWAYYAMFPSLNPANPDYPWPRPAYGSVACRKQKRGCTYSDYPYQELVMGLVANPPGAGVGPDGEPTYLWEPKPVTLPERRLFIRKRAPRQPLWPPPVLPEPAIETLDEERSPAPELALDDNAASLSYEAADPRVFALPVATILNAGTGLIAPNIKVRLAGPTPRWLSSWTLASRVTPAQLLVTFHPGAMKPGHHTATFTVTSPVAEASPQVFTLNVCVGDCGYVH